MRKDDDVEIPSLTLDQDEISDRPSSVNPAAQAKKRRLNPPPAKPTPGTQATSVRAKKQSLFGVYFLLLLILAAAGAGGYWLWLDNQKLRNELTGAKSQIQDLDHQLLAADVSSDKLGATVEEVLKNHDSEIRKLWGVAYDRNRGNISANTEALEKLDGRLGDLRETVSTQSKRVAVQADAFNEVENGYNRLIDSVAAVEVKQTAQDESVSELVAKGEQNASALSAQQGSIEAMRLQLDEISSRLDSLANSLEEQRRLVASASDSPSVTPEMEAQLNSYDEAIKSIDEFRPQVLREINSLKAQVRQISLQQTLSLDE